jgi:hypothetical protein
VSYADFLERKIRQTDGIGIDVDPVDLNQWMHPWQREIVAWAARRGRAAPPPECSRNTSPATTGTT